MNVRRTHNNRNKDTTNRLYSSSEHQVFKKFLARLSFAEIYPFQKTSACLYRHQKKLQIAKINFNRIKLEFKHQQRLHYN